VLVSVAVVGCGLLQAGAASKDAEKSYGELVQVAKARTQHPYDRVAAIEKLAAITEPRVLTDFRVGDELIGIVKPDTAKPDDVFVRAAAVKALGQLQVNTDKMLKTRYIAPLTVQLRDNKTEHLVVRKAIAQIFADTLDNSGLTDKEAYKGLVDIARLKDAPEGLRMACIRAVGTFGSNEGLDVLVALLSDQVAQIRESAAGALFVLLNTLGSADIPLPAVNKLVEMLSNKTMAAELRVNVMKVVAQLIRDGNLAAKQAMPVILGMVRGEKDPKLVKGGIQALGIIGSAEGVEALKTAYADFMPAAGAQPAAPAAALGGAAAAAPAENATDVEVRAEVIRALVAVLNAQDRNKQPDAKAVHETALLLVKAVDDDPTASVKEAAVFAMRYLYPQKFKSEHKEIIDSLIYNMRQAATSDATKQKVVEALEAITGQDFGTDAERWDKWYQAQFRVPPRKPAAAPAPAEPK
jgi:hypothetical protein